MWEGAGDAGRRLSAERLDAADHLAPTLGVLDAVQTRHRGHAGDVLDRRAEGTLVAAQHDVGAAVDQYHRVDLQAVHQVPASHNAIANGRPAYTSNPLPA